MAWEADWLPYLRAEMVVARDEGAASLYGWYTGLETRLRILLDNNLTKAERADIQAASPEGFVTIRSKAGMGGDVAESGADAGVVAPDVGGKRFFAAAAAAENVARPPPSRARACDGAESAASLLPVAPS